MLIIIWYPALIIFLENLLAFSSARGDFESLFSALLTGSDTFVFFLVTLILSKEISAQTSAKSIYKNGWIDFNKNGIKDIFEDRRRYNSDV